MEKNYRVVSESRRSSFMTKMFGMQSVKFEDLIFTFAEEMLADQHKGGYWEICSTGNTMFMYIDEDKTYEVSSPNYYSCELNSVDTGITLSLIALSHMTFYLFEKGINTDKVSNMFYELRDFAATRKEAAKIFALID